MAKLSSVKSQLSVGLPQRSAARKKLDEVEVSLASKLAVHLQDSGAVRTELVQRVRKEIADGTFETPERIDRTVDRLLEELYPD